MEHKRIQWLDFAKGILILCVVMIHQFGRYSFIQNILDIFAMPLFFAISGYLYKPTYTIHKYMVMLYKKITSLIIPYIIFTCIILIIPNIHQGFLHYVLAVGWRTFIVPFDYLWFLYALFFIFLIISFLNLIHIKLYIQIFLSILFFFGSLYIPLIVRNHGGFNPLKCIGGYMLCFYLGYILRKDKFTEFSINHKYFPDLLSILWILSMLIEIYINGINNDTDFFHYYDIVSKLLSIPCFFSLFIKFPKDRFFRYFDKYGKFTLLIYLVHRPIFYIPWFKFIITNNSVFMLPLHIILIIFAWYVSLFVCHLSDKYKFINFVFYPRKYINTLFKNK